METEARERWLGLKRRGLPDGWADKVVSPASGWPLAYLDAGCKAALEDYFEWRDPLLFGDAFVELQALLPQLEAGVAATATDPSANAYLSELLALLKHVETRTRPRGTAEG